MRDKKICKKCKIFVEGHECPICQGTQFADNYSGKLIITNPEESEIAKKLNITRKGTYAIKIK